MHRPPPLDRRRRRRKDGDAAQRRPLTRMAIPFLPAAALLLMSPTWSLRGTIDWEFRGKLDGLVGVIEVYSHFAALLLTAVVVRVMRYCAY